MKTALLEFLAAATRARIVPSDLAATQSTNFRQPREKVDPWGWRGPAVSDAHLDLRVFDIAENG